MRADAQEEGGFTWIRWYANEKVMTNENADVDVNANKAADPCRILFVVDDEPDIRETLRLVLECEGYSVETAANGREALELLQRAVPCVILLDLMMPVMNGWEFAEQLRQRPEGASIPVVVVTAFRDRAEGVPCQGVLGKPFDLDALFQHVRRHCS